MMTTRLSTTIRLFISKNNQYYLLREALRLLTRDGPVVFLQRIYRRLKRQRSPRVACRLRTDIGPVFLPEVPRPHISIVIPVFNQALYTFNCLLSIAEHGGNTPFEVIVVDNASTDNTAHVLSVVANVKVIRNATNRGFVDACNIGAGAAQGTYILFLNNDTMITDGCFAALLKVFDEHADCGAVGAKLVYPDGTLQEAGGIIWRDGSGWNVGKFDRADKPEYSYLREVDYCSGAALMIRKDLFGHIGGFDRAFAPAYWEDTDICFAVRRLGRKVFFQPAAVVVHFEGITAGTRTTDGMKRYQDINTTKFTRKWKEELTTQYEYSPENLFLARDRRRAKRLLIVDHIVPQHDKDAGSFFMYSLINVLTELGYRIVFWPDNLDRNDPYGGILQQMGVEVMYGRQRFTTFMKRYGACFDAAILTRNHVAVRYIDTVKKYLPNVMYHDPDLEFLREQRRVALEGGRASSLTKIKEREFYLFNASDIIGTHSPVERDIILAHLPASRVRVIPLPVSNDTKTTTLFAERKNLLFVGSSHPPNVDALRFFVNEVQPLVAQSLPEVTLTIVGEVRAKDLLKAETPHVVLCGYVEDLRSFFEQARVFVAPLRYGAGIKGKIIDAMSYGVPVVTTSIGAEGMDLMSDENVMIADSPAEFARAIVSVYHDEARWRAIVDNAALHVARNFSQAVFKTKVRETMEALLNDAHKEHGGR